MRTFNLSGDVYVQKYCSVTKFSKFYYRILGGTVFFFSAELVFTELILHSLCWINEIAIHRLDLPTNIDFFEIYYYALFLVGNWVVSCLFDCVQENAGMPENLTVMMDFINVKKKKIRKSILAEIYIVFEIYILST
jgi:hypothetical protein